MNPSANSAAAFRRLGPRNLVRADLLPPASRLFHRESRAIRHLLLLSFAAHRDSLRRPVGRTAPPRGRPICLPVDPRIQVRDCEPATITTRQAALYPRGVVSKTRPFMALSFEDLRRLVEQSEDARVELKETPSDQVLREFSTDIAAIANGKGGAIIFGVTDAKAYVGCMLVGTERDRISQEAARCRPPVQIDFDESASDDGKRFLVVRVPAATTLPHSDFRDKTPVRVGSITAYLDASGVVGWLNERGLLRREEARQSYLEAKREPVSDEEALVLAKALRSETREVRIEALRDVAWLCNRRVVLDRPELAAPLGRILVTGAPEELKFSLDALRSVVLWGSKEEKLAVDGWFDRISELARDVDDPVVAKVAFDVLECARREEAAEILYDWVTKADDEAYRQLQPTNGLANVRFYNLDRPMRAAMHRVMEGKPAETIRARASAVLEALRQAYG